MGERIVVLGGGVIGLATAFECRRRGMDVLLLEKNGCGGQASGAAAGMLAPFSEIGEDPDDFFLLCLESLTLYPEWQKEIKHLSGLDFEYSNSGSLYAVYHEADVLSLQTRQQWQSQFGANAEILDGKMLHQLERELSNEVIAALYYPGESHVYAPGYVKALEQACRNIGVKIEDHLEEVSIKSWKEDIQIQAKNGHTYTGDKLIVCSGAWAKELEDVFDISIPIYPIRGQICSYDMTADKVRHIVYTPQGYFVPKANGTLVNGASEDIAGFNTTVTEKGISRLTNWNKHVFPFLEKETPTHTWAGLRPATQDGSPFIGALGQAPHIIFAAGHYRNGILLSPVTAYLVADIIEKKSPRIPTSMFSPERFS